LKEVTEHHTHSSVDQDVCENPEKMEQELSVLQNTMNRLQQEHSVAVKNALESQNIVEQLKTKILKADVNDHSAKQKSHEVEFLRQRILDLERELEQSKQVAENSEANVETGRSRREDPGEAEEVSIADENDTEEKEELRKRLAEKSALLEQHKKFSKYAQEKMKSLVDQNTSLKNQLEESEHIQREYEESLQDAESELAKLRKNLNDALKELPRHRFRLDEEDMSSDPEASGNSAEEDQDQSEDDDNDDDDEVEVIDLVKVDRSDEGGEGDTGDDETEEANYYSSDEDQSTAGKLTDKQDHDDAHGSKRKREQSGDSSHEEGCDDIEDDADTADDDEDDLDVVEIVDKPASKKQK
jgi:chromosome segregation ATPase